MQAVDILAKAAEQASACMRHLHADQLDNPTPCTEWNVRQLVNHMVSELRWMPPLLQGKRLEDVGSSLDGDLLGTDPGSAWQHAVDAALVASKRAAPDSTVHTSSGQRPAPDYIEEVGVDIFIHSWDLDQGLQCSLRLDETIARYILDTYRDRAAEMAASGVYQPPVQVPPDAPVQDKLLGLFGRKAPTAAAT